MQTWPECNFSEHIFGPTVWGWRGLFNKLSLGSQAAGGWEALARCPSCLSCWEAAGQGFHCGDLVNTQVWTWSLPLMTLWCWAGDSPSLPPAPIPQACRALRTEPLAQDPAYGTCSEDLFTSDLLALERPIFLSTPDLQIVMYRITENTVLCTCK